MARVAKAELLLPFWFVTGEAEAAQRDWAVPADLVRLTVAEVASTGSGIPATIAGALAQIGEKFASERSARSYYGEPGRQKQLLKALRDGGDVRGILDALAPEFLIELTRYLHPAEAAWVLDPVGDPADIIASVRVLAAAFLLNYRPRAGRRTDLPLETAVRALIDLLEPVLGEPLRVAGNKNNGRSGPSPNCAGSRAILLLLRGIDPQLTVAAIMNMIATVRSRSELTEDPLVALFRSNPIGELDASLLPGREEAIQQLRDDPINGFA